MIFLAMCLLCLAISSAAAEPPQKVNLGPKDQVVVNAVERINKNNYYNGDRVTRKLVRVVNATKQIDNAVIYRLELLLKDPNNKFLSCKIKFTQYSRKSFSWSNPECVQEKQ